MVPNRLPSFWCGGRAVAPSGCRMSVPRTMRALGSQHAPPLRAAAAGGGLEAAEFAMLETGFGRSSRGGLPVLVLGRPVASFFMPPRQEPRPGCRQSRQQSAFAEPNCSANASKYTARLRAAFRTRVLAALQATTPQSGSVITSSLNTSALTLPQLRPPLAQLSDHRRALAPTTTTPHDDIWPTTPSPTY